MKIKSALPNKGLGDPKRSEGFLDELFKKSLLNPKEIGAAVLLAYCGAKNPDRFLGWICENGCVAYLCYLRSFLPDPERITFDDKDETYLTKCKKFLKNLILCMVSNLIAEQGSVFLLHIVASKVFAHIPYFSKEAAHRTPLKFSAFRDWWAGNAYLQIGGGGLLLALMESFQPQWTYDELAETPFKPLRFIRNFAVFRIVVDLVFYAGHRILHVYPFIYQLIHRRHHGHFKTSLATNFHFSAPDLFIESAGPIFAGMLVLRALGVKMGRTELHTFMTYAAWHESGTHMGKNAPCVSMLPMLSPIYNTLIADLDSQTILSHEVHHNFRHCNYGITPWLDNLLGTARLHERIPTYWPK